MPSQSDSLILASSSRHRAALLRRLQLSFAQVHPEIDETAQENEKPQDLALRLAREKAQKVAREATGSVVIGSDQVVACDEILVSKPGDRAKAVEQLGLLRGNTAIFYTGLQLLAPNGFTFAHVDQTIVRFRALSDAEIERYLDAEPATDCAGSFRSEAFGIALCEEIHSTDPSALIGLPLIALAKGLRSAGFHLP